MTQCPRCNVWLPVDYDHSRAECDEHVKQSAEVKARAAAIWCRICLTGVTLPVQLGDHLACTVAGQEAQAVVVGVDRKGNNPLVSVSGLHEHHGSKVTRDLFDQMTVSFHINRDGTACTSLWWK